MTEQWEEQLERALHATHPKTTPSAGWEPRARAAITQARPRRLRRVIAVTAAALVVLLGLGFVPIPLGRVSGSLDRALAAMEQLTTLHVVSWRITPEGTEEQESWYSADGFFRNETRLDGTLTEVTVADGAHEKRWSYLDEARTQATVWHTFSPIRWRDPATWRPPDSRVGSIYEAYQRMCEQALTNVVTLERREYRPWRGAIDVVEFEASVQEPCTFMGFSFARGDRLRLAAEVEVASNHLLSLKEYCFQDGWQPVYEVRYQWDVEIPEELHEFRPPEGAEVRRYDWWERRVTQILAEGEVADCRVVIHGVDVNEKGDVLLSLAFERHPDCPPAHYRHAGPALVEARDSAGVTYEQDHSRWGGSEASSEVSYWVVWLYRDPQAAAQASTITFTIFPYLEGEGADQSATFTVPLPERQEGDDLLKKWR